MALNSDDDLGDFLGRISDQIKRDNVAKLGLTPPVKVAKVRKMTPVKEGQEPQVAKGGHYRLWNEHVWPKGYTPERLREVENATKIYAVKGDSGVIPYKEYDTPPASRSEQLHRDAHAAQSRDTYARNYLNRHLARSTMPIEHLKQIQRGGFDEFGIPEYRRLGVTVSPHTSAGTRGGRYFPHEHDIVLGTHPHNTQVDEQRSVVHELGHAYDSASNLDEVYGDASSIKFDPSSLRYGPAGVAHPRLEGFAEGYSLGHSRITRAGRRVGGTTALVGYVPQGWADPDAGQTFRETRDRAYNEAMGEQKPANTSTTSNPEPEVEPQPGLFD